MNRPSSGDSPKIVIVKRRAKEEEGHHGGAWKVAYADFVTAMMAFFLVMWIMSMDQGVKDLVQGYFQNPIGFKRSFSGGTNPLAAGNSITNMKVKRTVILNRRQQEARFKAAAAAIRTNVELHNVMAGLDAKVDVVVTDEGLRIEFMETGDKPVFFDKASSTLKPALEKALSVVGSVLKTVPGDVVVEGHTDALPYDGARYSNWELSVDRANAARRELQNGGLAAKRITEVRGYADRQLKIPSRPLDPRNRRISVLLPFKEVSLDTLEVTSLGVAGVRPASAVEPEGKGD